MSVSFREGLVRAIAAALTIAVVAATWDVWWHSAVGRDTFWEPPHLFLYSAALCVIAGLLVGAMVSTFDLFRRTRVSRV